MKFLEDRENIRIRKILKRRGRRPLFHSFAWTYINNAHFFPLESSRRQSCSLSLINPAFLRKLCQDIHKMHHFKCIALW